MGEGGQCKKQIRFYLVGGLHRTLERQDFTEIRKTLGEIFESTVANDSSISGSFALSQMKLSPPANGRATEDILLHVLRRHARSHWVLGSNPIRHI